jgi:hypothetical protein
MRTKYVPGCTSKVDFTPKPERFFFLSLRILLFGDKFSHCQTAPRAHRVWARKALMVHTSWASVCRST